MAFGSLLFLYGTSAFIYTICITPGALRSISPHTHQFYLEHQNGMTGNAMRAARPITHFRRQIDTPFVAHMHPHKGNLPARDEFAQTKCVGTGLTRVVIEHLARDEHAFVEHRNNAVGVGRFALTRLQHFIQNALGLNAYALALGHFLEKFLILQFKNIAFLHIIILFLQKYETGTEPPKALDRSGTTHYYII